MTAVSDDLIAIARELADRDAGRPRQSSLGRAISAAYYAMFRAILHEVVSQTFTWGFRSPRYWDAVTPLYRAVDHAHAKATFNRVLGENGAPVELKRLARVFVDLQAERIRADYDPNPNLRRSEASELIEQAADANTLLRALPGDEKRLLVARLLGKQR